MDAEKFLARPTLKSDQMTKRQNLFWKSKFDRIEKALWSIKI